MCIQLRDCPPCGCFSIFYLVKCKFDQYLRDYREGGHAIKDLSVHMLIVYVDNIPEGFFHGNVLSKLACLYMATAFLQFLVFLQRVCQSDLAARSDRYLTLFVLKDVPEGCPKTS